MLKIPLSKIRAYELYGDELWLMDQVLDLQIVDTEGRRVVRVNDLQILPRESSFISPVWMSAGCGCGSEGGHGRLVDIALPGTIVW